MNHETQQANELPAGWVWTTLGELAEYVNGRAFKPSEWESTGRPIIRIQNLTGSTDVVNRYSGEVEEKHIVRHGDLLISWSATLGVFIYRGEEAVLNQHIFRVTPYGDKNYLYYLVSAFIDDLRRQVHGSGMQHITKGKFENSRVPLAPLPEQHRIVAEIETQFTRLDAGVAALKQVQAKLRRYKAAVLKAACEGRLVPTEAELARVEGRVYESGSALLARILAERRARWQQANPGKRYVEPKGVDAEGLADLPEGWVWARVGQLLDVTIGGTPARAKAEYWNGHIPWVSSGEVRNNRIRETRESITAEGLASSNAKLHPPGTVLLAMIGEGKTRGQAALLEVAATTNQNVASILCSESWVAPEWVFYWLNSRYEETRKSGSGGMQYALNSERIRSFAMPLPPLTEQYRIVAEVERRLSVAQEVESTVAAGLRRAERLRQSILKRAFTGRLVGA